jgi:hypothetical protein
MIRAVIAFAYNDVEVGLAGALCVANSLLQNLFCLFDELPMQVNGIACDFSDGIVLAEDVLRGLFVVLVGLCSMFLALFA